MLGGGLLLAVVLLLAEQRIAAAAVTVFALFMAYWTSPLRSGPHSPLEDALARRGDLVTIVLWAPGNPLSARLQSAIRSPGEELVWVNVHRDPAAQELLAEHGGASALPLVLVGEEVQAAASVAELREMQDRGRGRAAEG